MHGENLLQREVESATFFQAVPVRPLPVRTVGLERVRDAIVESTSEGIAKAKREDLERWYRFGEEATPESEVEDRAPVCRGRTRWGGGGHEVECFAEIGRVSFEVHERTVERLVRFACAKEGGEVPGCQPTCHGGRKDVTPAVPLRDEFVLHQRFEVACDEHVHVDPHAAIVPDDKQTDEVTVDPRFLVVQLKQLARLHCCARGEGWDIGDTERERVGITLKVLAHDRALAQVVVRPEDEAGAGEVLSGEKGFEHELLAFPERDEVRAPIGVVLVAIFGWYPGDLVGVVLW